MNAELFDFLQKRYSPVIRCMIEANGKFYRTNQTIQWQFGYKERVAIFAWCDRKTNVLTINIASVDFAFQRNEPLQIEYFLLHEIRHIYQHFEKETYKVNPLKCNNAELARKWLEEEMHYVPALDKANKENAGYFKQDMELDAYAYAFAVMKYKYGNVPYLYIPKAYEGNSEFSEIVDNWIQVFREEGL